MKIPPYCTQNGGHCDTCALSSYHRDCRNNPIGGSKTNIAITIGGTPYVSYKQAAGMIGIQPISVRQLVSNGAIAGAGGYAVLDSVEQYIRDKMARKATPKTKKPPVD